MRNKIFALVALLVIASMTLAACQTTAPQATTEPTTAPVAKEWKSKDPTTYNFVTFGGPETLDPALDYETSGGSIVLNVYDTLVFYNKDNASDFVPQLATEVPSVENGGISADGKTITFKIRQGVKFHDGTTLTPADVAYTFQRGLLQGGTASPQWLLVEPIFGVGLSDIVELVPSDVIANNKELNPQGPITLTVEALYDDPGSLAKIDAATLEGVCKKVTDAVVADDAAGTVTFHLAQPWGPFLATVAQNWGAIQSKAWVVTNGGWDGDCKTWQNFYGKTSEEINKTGLGTSAMGTGPYKLDHWTQGEEIVLKANESYWRTEPAWTGGPSGVPALKTVIIKQVDKWSTRFAMLQAGDADNITLSSSSDWPQMDEVSGVSCTYDEFMAGNCKETDPNKPLVRITGVTSTSRQDAFFTFKISTVGGNNFLGSGKLDGNGIPSNFFSDLHVRRAFAYCFNYDQYFSDVMMSEGVRSVDVMLPGEIGYNANDPFYGNDPAKCEEEFKASKWNETGTDADGNPTYEASDTGTISLWDTGFRMTIAYNSGNTSRQTAAQIFQTELSTLNANFIIEVTGLPWPAFLQAQRAKKLPIFISGWLEDIHDPHNWVVPYTTGTYGGRQNMPADVKAKFAEIMSRGVVEPDPTKRAAIYAEFNKLYYDTLPTILLYVAAGHRYQARYVQGWYNNPAYSGQYYYPSRIVAMSFCEPRSWTRVLSS